MNASDYIGGNTVTVDVLKASKTKQLVILSEGSEKSIDNKKKLEFLVEMDGRRKNWTMNATTLKNLIDVYGEDTKTWVGKTIKLELTIINSREAIIGRFMPQTNIN
jgi:hypothetical protein